MNPIVPPIVEIRSVCQVGSACVVTARAVGDDGRTADAIGIATVAALTGDALTANIERAEQAARTRAVMLLSGGDREPPKPVAAPAPNPPTAPVKPVPKDEPEMVVPGDPTTDMDELLRLAQRKRVDWVAIVKWINSNCKAAYGYTSTQWLKMNRHHRAACVAWLSGLGDQPIDVTPAHDPKPRAPTAGDVWRTFEAIAKITKLEPLEECCRYLKAVKLNCSLDDLTDAQLIEALASAQAKLKTVRIKAGGGKVS